ncbi:type II toxin-antitoxin system RatA family toxin [Kyrpidia spormannii]|nr:SRPBCC family protein [Kyrpidia spormannii]
MPVVQVRESFAGPWHEVFDWVANFERYPEFVPDLTKVVVLERGEDWTISRWEAKIGGTPLGWTERDVWVREKEGGRIVFEQLEGDLKRFSGHWKVACEGLGSTAEFRCEFEIGLPGLAIMLHPVAGLKLRQSMAGLLRNLKIRVEAAEDGTSIRFLDSPL